MSQVWANYWPLFLVAVAIGLIVGFMLFRPRQRVTLTRDEAPVRPHMAASANPPSPRDRDGGGEGNSIADSAAAAVSDVSGQFLETPVHSNLPGSQGVPDDLQRMKGVGPKLAGLLNARGLMRFEQIAALSNEDVARIDAEMGAFRGRLVRDRIVEQAAFLARGDDAGYEAQFGRL